MKILTGQQKTSRSKNEVLRNTKIVYYWEMEKRGSNLTETFTGPKFVEKASMIN